MMKIVVLGDVGASDSNHQAFLNADADLFSDEIQKLCAGADIVLLNLEKPLTDVITPLGKCPPDYYAPTGIINGIKLIISYFFFCFSLSPQHPPPLLCSPPAVFVFSLKQLSI